MAMTDNARPLNLKKSLDVYITDNYSETSIERMGVQLNKSALSEWLRFTFVGPDGSPAGREGGKSAIWQDLILELACFVKTPGPNAGRIWDIAGKAAVTFERVDVPLIDYELVGKPTVGYIRCLEADLSYQGIDETLGFQVEHLAITIPAQWHETKG